MAEEAAQNRFQALSRREIVVKWADDLEQYRTCIHQLNNMPATEEEEAKKQKFVTLRNAIIVLDTLETLFVEFEVKSGRTEPPGEKEATRCGGLTSRLHALLALDANNPKDVDMVLRGFEAATAELQENLDAQESALHDAKLELRSVAK